MTDFALASIPGPVGSLQRARLYAPGTGAGTGAAVADLALVESPVGTFGGTLTLSPQPADDPAVPYEVEVRQVASQDDASFDASMTVTLSRGAYAYMVGGSWQDAPLTRPQLLADRQPVRRPSIVAGYPVTVVAVLTDDAGRPYDAPDGTDCTLTIQRDDVGLSVDGAYAALTGAASFPMTAQQASLPVGLYSCRVVAHLPGGVDAPTEAFTLEVTE